MRAFRVACVGIVTATIVGVMPTAAVAATPTCFGERATKVGTNGKDTIRGTTGADVIFAGGGADRVLGRGGNDLICGSGGTDYLNGGGGDDRISTAGGADDAIGGPGNDELKGGDVHGQYLIGGPGDDALDGGADPYDLADFELAPGPVTVDLVTGTATGDGTDTLVGIENATGSNYPDTLIGNELDNVFYGWDGNDVITTAGGNDIAVGAAGDDEMDGGDGTDQLLFYTADVGVHVDLQQGTATGDGNDSLTGFEDVDGSYYGDEITGDAGSNSLSGGDGNDQLFGGAGDDYLYGDEGASDSADGGPGSDVCEAETRTGCDP